MGMCIFDISILKIYDFHYGYMRSRFEDNARVCYTDTDSLIYVVQCEGVYETIRTDSEEFFDTSDYPDDNVFKIPQVNKKVLGMMKDENAGKLMTEFVGLRSKSYAIRVEGKDAVKRSESVKRNIVKNRRNFDDYYRCLINDEDVCIEQKTFQCRNHDDKL